LLPTTETKRVLTIPKPKPVPTVFEHLTIEQMPRFPGCEELGLSNLEIKECADEKLRRFLLKHISYPIRAKEMPLEGRVAFSFIIDEKGEVTELEILKDPGSKFGYQGLGKEVLRASNRMPKWIPGKQAGKEVKVKYYTSVLFELR
jgi:protein TonB